MSSPAKIIVLDRDGVINLDSKDYIKTVDEWRPIPGSIEAIATLSRSGYKVAIATNQSGIGRGLYDELALAQMHGKMQDLVEAAGGTIDTVCYCPHTPETACRCRKPATGLLEQIAAEMGDSLTGCLFVGDSLKDMQAAIAYAMQPILVRTGNGEKTETQLEQFDVKIPVYDSLADVVADQLDSGTS